jgi:hypothetical protein
MAAMGTSMAPRQAFGRRVSPQAFQAPSRRAPVPAPQPVAAEVAAPALVPSDQPSLDTELSVWKQARGSQFKMPWSQLSLMASLCFGIASFVLPDSVNQNVDWLLWGLSIMAAWVWYSNRKKKELASPNIGHPEQ